MTDTPTAWFVAVGGGVAVAALYFAGLWWTVRRAAHRSRPGMFVAGSFLVRGLLAAALLVGLAGGDPWRLLAAIGAFLAVRTLAVWFARATPPSAPVRRPFHEGG